jgi:Fe-S oxidoreductase
MLEGDGEDKPLAGGVITDDVLWSCTTCKACVEACPVEINQMGLILELRRSLVFEMQTPSTLGQSLKRTTNSANPWGLPNEDRLAWAKGLSVPLAAETEGGFEWLYWVGCSASFDPRNQKIACSMVKLLEASGVNYAVLGPEEKCTAEWARRAGEEGLFQMNTLENIETFKRYNVSKILTHCPHCLNTLKNDYPQFGFQAQVVHHSTLLRDLLKQGRLKLGKKTPESLVFHDSCYLGRYNGVYDAPRELLHAVAKSPIREMERRREKSFCCGGGGGLSWMELDIGKKINHERIEEAAATGGKTLAAACPFCVFMFDDAIKVKNLEEEIKVKDLSEILVECL